MSASVMVHEILGVEVFHREAQMTSSFSVVDIRYDGGEITLIVRPGQRLEVARFLQEAATMLRLGKEDATSSVRPTEEPCGTDGTGDLP